MLVHLLSLLAPVLVFGLVIFVHELGHFLAAKACGVYAPRFSVGFGPALWRHKWGETEYILAALPLGGYVRMASRLDEEMAMLEGGSENMTLPTRGVDDGDAPAAPAQALDPNEMAPFGSKPIPEDRLFESKSLGKRLIILLAGVTMNGILAFGIVLGLRAYFGRAVIESTVVGDVRTVAGAPRLAELRSGDTIRAVNGTPVASFDDVLKRVRQSTTDVRITTQRGEVAVPVNRPDAPSADSVAAAIDVFVPAVFDEVISGERAAAAGFQPGDSVVAISGASVTTWPEFVAVVSRSADQPLDIDVVRKGARRTIQVTPRATRDVDPATGKARVVGRIGAGVRPPPYRREALEAGVLLTVAARETWSLVTSTAGVVKHLVTGQVSLSQLSGPVGITKMSVEAARGGFDRLLYLIALLSVNIAVLNLLPIPVLDGGQVTINVLESAKGSPFSLRTREYILRFGLLAIALLFVVVMYNDTSGWLMRAAGWVRGLFG